MYTLRLTSKKTMQINFTDTIDSTNLYLYTKATEGVLTQDTALVAYEQTMGKGRRGRDFFSPKQTGIYLSILLHPDATVRETTLITTMLACAAAKALEKNNSPRILIKWVNDLYVNERKVGGILTECSSNIRELKPEFVVVGIGINLLYPQGGFPNDIEQKAGVVYEKTISSKEAKALKDKVAMDIIETFMEYYARFPDKGYIDDYKERLFIVGRRVQIVDGPKVIVRGIDDDFGLIVELPDGSVKTMDAGEVSLIL